MDEKHLPKITQEANTTSVDNNDYTNVEAYTVAADNNASENTAVIPINIHMQRNNHLTGKSLILSDKLSSILENYI